MIQPRKSLNANNVRAVRTTEPLTLDQVHAELDLVQQEIKRRQEPDFGWAGPYDDLSRSTTTPTVTTHLYPGITLRRRFSLTSGG